MHWNKPKEKKKWQPLTLRGLNWDKMQKYGISKVVWLLQWVCVWLREGDAACLNRPMNSAGVKRKKVWKEKALGYFKKSLKSPYWVTEVGQESVKVH